MNPLSCTRCGAPVRPAATGCHHCGVAFDAPAPAGGGLALAVGDRVVALWQPGRYYEGKVTARNEHRATVAWSDGSSPSAVSLLDVFPLPGASHGAEIGELVLAKFGTGTRWYGATITSISEYRIGVRYTDGMTGELAPDEILRIPEATKADLATGEQAAATPAPVVNEPRVLVPPGWRPAPGQRVAAVWRKVTWYSGLVVSVGPEGVMVAWEDGSPPSAVPFHRVAPVPDGIGPLAPVNARVLLAPRTGAAWSFAKVIASSPRGCEVELDDGSRRSVPRGAYLVFA